MFELVERATSGSVFRSGGNNVRRDFAGRLTHARFRVRMMDDTGRSEREPAGRAEAMILRRHRHRAAPVQFHSLEQADLLLWRIGRTRTAFGRAFAVMTQLIEIVRQWIGLTIYGTKRLKVSATCRAG
jgi:hypothetical protein